MRTLNCLLKAEELRQCSSVGTATTGCNVDGSWATATVGLHTPTDDGRPPPARRMALLQLLLADGTERTNKHYNSITCGGATSIISSKVG